MILLIFITLVPGHTFTEEECEEMFRLSDTNADGKIDWEEFLQMMLPGRNVTKLFTAVI
jgi:Ca2+-binding EF-hand superfamily protein